MAVLFVRPVNSGLAVHLNWSDGDRSTADVENVTDNCVEFVSVTSDTLGAGIK